MRTAALPSDGDVCILGAGPHGLAAAHHLRTADPDLRIVVIDPAGAWLTTWHDNFAKAEITTLRSPIVHHVAHDPSALARFQYRSGLPQSGLPYDVPTIECFTAFCDAVIANAELPTPVPVQVNTIENSGRGLVLQTDAGNHRTRHLVVATNPHRRVVPEWTWPLLGRRAGLVAYGQDIDLRSTGSLTGRRIAVVGGGLTAAHLAVGASARGADVHLLSRHPIRIRNFDTDPGWLGPKFLDAFDAEGDASRRLAIARAARDGGSIPPWMHERLSALAEDDCITLHEGVSVASADVALDGHCILDLSGEDALHADSIWLATGTVCDITSMRCLRSLADDAPLDFGHPLVDRNLRLGPHPVFLMGRLATAALGPAAGNLWGAQRASRRITELLTGVDLRGESIATIPRAD